MDLILLFPKLALLKLPNSPSMFTWNAVPKDIPKIVVALYLRLCSQLEGKPAPSLKAPYDIKDPILVNLFKDYESPKTSFQYLTFFLDTYASIINSKWYWFVGDKDANGKNIFVLCPYGRYPAHIENIKTAIEGLGKTNCDELIRYMHEQASEMVNGNWILSGNDENGGRHEDTKEFAEELLKHTDAFLNPKQAQRQRPSNGESLTEEELMDLTKRHK